MNRLKGAIAQCVARMSILKYFPSDPIVRAEIMKLIERMITEPHQAEWLAEMMTKHFNEWPGPLALRAMVSQRWKPADGVEADMQGFGGTLETEIIMARYLESEERKQITPGAQKLLAEFVPVEKMALTVIDQEPGQQRRAEQTSRWVRVCHALPAIKRTSKALCAEFTSTRDLDRREVILKQFEQAADRVVAFHGRSQRVEASK